MKRTTASVIIEKTAYSFDKPYDYIVPENLIDVCRAGCRVVVPFGKGDTRRQGLVLSVNSCDTDQPLKSILAVADATPILNDEMLKLCEWLHETLFCTYFDAVNAVLPTGVSLKVVEFYKATDICVTLTDEEACLYEFIKGNTREITAEVISKAFGEASIKLLATLENKGAVERYSNAVSKMKDATLKSVRAIKTDLSSVKLTERQKEVAEYILANPELPVKEVQYYTGASVSIIDALVSKGVAQYFQKEIFRMPVNLTNVTDTECINLTDEQQTAYDELEKALGKGESALLYGVTGSGKTKVFLKLVDKVIKDNKGVIIMVPEISLTPQMISIFSSRYGNKIAVFHSAMSLGQRMDEWKRVKKGEALIAIGTRSAIFAPSDNLGLIIMDEEQEHTYKSEQSPRFHARDVARFRAKYHGALFLMASATPSLETFTAAKNGKYHLCTLKNRYGNAVLPETEIVDMRLETQSGNMGAVSGVLYDEINSALESGNQAIVLLNRRGHNTHISCMSCGEVVSCPNCSVSLTYHSANKRAMCHYCGYSVTVPEKCENCGDTHLRYSGVGTQKVEEELKMLFPTAKVLRLDADSTTSKDSYSQYLTDFADGKYDIMLGTQMVAKGLDFKDVTVVGVLGADRAENSEDYRSAERTFSLLTQVVGRAGRGEKSGKAVIQTLNPDSNIISLAQSQDYDAFYDGEIKMRRLMTYPPYCDIISISVQSTYQNAALDSAKDILNKLKELVSGEYSDTKIIVLGPAPALMPKINNKYKFKLLIKCKNSKRTRSLIREATQIKMKYDTSVTVDINPESVL